MDRIGLLDDFLLKDDVRQGTLSLVVFAADPTGRYILRVIHRDKKTLSEWD